MSGGVVYCKYTTARMSTLVIHDGQLCKAHERRDLLCYDSPDLPSKSGKQCKLEAGLLCVILQFECRSFLLRSFYALVVGDSIGT